MFVFTASKRGIKRGMQISRLRQNGGLQVVPAGFLWVNHFSFGIEESFQGSNYGMNGKSRVFFLRVYIAQKLSYKEKSLRLL